MESSKMITNSLVFIERTWELHRLLNSQEFMLFFQRAHIRFPAPISDSSDHPVTPAPNDSVFCSGLFRYLFS